MSDWRSALDLVVVGAGPAGLAAAAAAASGGHRVAVVDRGAGIGVPVRTSGGSFIAPLERLGLPPRLWHPLHRIRFIGPGQDLSLSYRRPLGCVIDVRATYQWLAARAADAGAHLRLRTTVMGPHLVDDELAGVVLRDGEVVTARLVVDASGYNRVVARQVGLAPTSERSAIGHEQEVYAPHFDQDEAYLVVGQEVAPGGYAWAFPCGESRVRLGVGVVRPDSEADPRELLDALIDRVPALRHSCAVAEPLEVHTGVMPAFDPTGMTLASTNLLIVGDAGGQGSTLLGEGIRYAIAGGRLAGEVAAKALGAQGRVPLATLEEYPQLWGRRVGRQMRLAYRLHLRACTYDDAAWAQVLDVFGQLRPQQLARALATDLTVGWALRVLATSPRAVLGRRGRSLVRTVLAGR